MTNLSWKDISIKKYIQLYNLKDLDEMDSIIKQTSIIFDKPESDVERMKLSEYNELSTHLHFLSGEPESTDLKKEFILDGAIYKLKDFNSFTLGEWVDLEHWNKDTINNLHFIMSILYQNPDIDVADSAMIFYEKLDIETTLSAFFFFYLFGLNFIPSDIKDCSMLDKVMNQMNQLKQQLNLQE